MGRDLTTGEAAVGVLEISIRVGAMPFSTQSVSAL
jgi:hypothetical protein